MACHLEVKNVSFVFSTLFDVMIYVGLLFNFNENILY